MFFDYQLLLKLILFHLYSVFYFLKIKLLVKVQTFYILLKIFVFKTNISKLFVFTNVVMHKNEVLNYINSLQFLLELFY